MAVSLGYIALWGWKLLVINVTISCDAIHKSKKNKIRKHSKLHGFVAKFYWVQLVQCIIMFLGLINNLLV